MELGAGLDGVGASTEVLVDAGTGASELEATGVDGAPGETSTEVHR